MLPSGPMTAEPYSDTILGGGASAPGGAYEGGVKPVLAYCGGGATHVAFKRS